MLWGDARDQDFVARFEHSSGNVEQLGRGFAGSEDDFGIAAAAGAIQIKFRVAEPRCLFSSQQRQQRCAQR